MIHILFLPVLLEACPLTPAITKQLDPILTADQTCLGRHSNLFAGSSDFRTRLMLDEVLFGFVLLSLALLVGEISRFRRAPRRTHGLAPDVESNTAAPEPEPKSIEASFDGASDERVFKGSMADSEPTESARRRRLPWEPPYPRSTSRSTSVASGESRLSTASKLSALPEDKTSQSTLIADESPSPINMSSPRYPQEATPRATAPRPAPDMSQGKISESDFMPQRVKQAQPDGSAELVQGEREPPAPRSTPLPRSHTLPPTVPSHQHPREILPPPPNEPLPSTLRQQHLSGDESPPYPPPSRALDANLAPNDPNPSLPPPPNTDPPPQPPQPAPKKNEKKTKSKTVAMLRDTALVFAILLSIFGFAVLIAHCLAWFLVYKTEARLGELHRGLLRGGEMRMCLCAR